MSLLKNNDRKFFSLAWMGRVVGLICFFLPIVLPIEDLDLAGKVGVGIFLLAAVFWITEAIPIYATSLLVIFLQTFLLSKQGLLQGFVEDGQLPSYTSYYDNLANSIVILFLGGFSLAAAAVKYQLDKNLTKSILRLFGSRPSNVLLGLLLTTALLSAFMSNTATTAMMITVCIPIAAGLPTGDPLAKAICLAIPVGANIGGIITPIGSPPNAVVLGALFDQGITFSFFKWMMLTTPIAVITLGVAWIFLQRLFKTETKTLHFSFDQGWDKSGKAILTYLVFGVTILLWVTGSFIGLSSSMVAFIPIALLPAFGILNSRDIRSFSWDVLWLMAGGISLGATMKAGPAEWLIGFVDWQGIPAVLIILLLALLAYGLSNLISNTVAATIFVPILFSLGQASIDGYNAVTATLVVGVVVSFAMILPISTPPNAIAISTGVIGTKDLKKIGFLVGAIGYACVVLSAYTYWNWIR